MGHDSVHTIFRSLSVRIAGVLGMALLPIGLIALFQTIEATRQLDRQVEMSYLAWTSDAAMVEQRFVERAFGAATAIGAVLEPLRENPGACTEYLSAYLEDNPQFSHVAFIPPSGLMTCSSSGQTHDFDGYGPWEKIAADPKPSVILNRDAPISKRPVLLVNQPIIRDGQWEGTVIVSIPHDQVELNIRPGGAVEPVEIITVNQSGELLSAALRDYDEAQALLPNAHDLRVLKGSAPKGFVAKSQGGESYYYAAVPIVRNTVYGLSVWPQKPSAMSAAIPAYIFPLIMWAASLVVAFFAVDRLVLRPVRTLNQEMNSFARNRALRYGDQVNRALGSSAEFETLHENFREMAENVMRDEAELENAVRQKTVLLKEVHHRVKNNLQMISSIMNMHARKSKASETSVVLRRLQDRVLGLAAIHKNLHEIEDMGQINAGRLLQDVGEQMIANAALGGRKPKVTFEIEDIVLFPDQTVPLCLFFSEALANALKYVDAPDGKHAALDVKLKADSDEMVRLSVTNTTTEEKRASLEGTGVGAQLMQAFATQLSGTAESADESLSHTVSVRFKAQAFSHEVKDY